MGKRKKDHDDTSASEAELEVGPSSSKRIKLEKPGEETKTDTPETAVKTAKPAPAPKSRIEVEMQAERDKMELLVSALSNTQQDQYEIFRRSTFPKSSVRKIMQSVCGSSVPQNAVIAMAGITKVYVGEIVEEACQSREALREEGPLQPKHIREAVRRLRTKDRVPNSRYKKVFPFR